MQAIIRILHDYRLSEITLTRGLLAFGVTMAGVLAVFFFTGLNFWIAASYSAPPLISQHLMWASHSILDHVFIGGHLTLTILNDMDQEKLVASLKLALCWYLGVRFLGMISSLSQKALEGLTPGGLRYVDWHKEIAYCIENELLESYRKEKRLFRWIQGTAQSLILLGSMLALLVAFAMFLTLFYSVFGWFSDYINPDEDLSSVLESSLFVLIFLWPLIRYGRSFRTIQVSLIAAFLAVLGLASAVSAEVVGPEQIEFWQVEIGHDLSRADARDDLILLGQQKERLLLLDRQEMKVFSLPASQTRIDYLNRTPYSVLLGELDSGSSTTLAK